MKRRLLILGSSFVFLWDCAVFLCRRLCRLPGADLGTVLVYHDVTDTDRLPFARHMAIIARHARCCHPNAPFSEIHGRHTVLVTFDDAYESIFRNAIPVMEQHSVPCLVFVPVGWLDQSPGWSSHGGSARGTSKIASAQILRQQAGRWVTFGAHGVHHLSLFEASDSDARREIVESKALLEKLLGNPISYFAFPYGHYRQSHLDLCRQAGYQAVFGATPGTWSPTEDFLVSRTSVSPTDGAFEFFLKVKGAYRWQAKLIKIKRKFTRVLPADALKLST